MLRFFGATHCGSFIVEDDFIKQDSLKRNEVVRTGHDILNYVLQVRCIFEALKVEHINFVIKEDF